MRELSPETKYLIKKWNSAKSALMRERYIKNHLESIYLNKDLIIFLDEFSSQIKEPDKRINFLFYFRKLLAQTQPKIDPDHYRAFEAEYNEDIANDTKIDGITWVDEEIKFIKEVNDPDLILSPINGINKSDQRIIVSAPYTSNQSDLLSLDEILGLFKISKTTFDRWREDGLPNIQKGKKIFAQRDELNKWIQTQPKKSKKVALNFDK